MSSTQTLVKNVSISSFKYVKRRLLETSHLPENPSILASSISFPPINQSSNLLDLMIGKRYQIFSIPYIWYLVFLIWRPWKTSKFCSAKISTRLLVEILRQSSMQLWFLIRPVSKRFRLILGQECWKDRGVVTLFEKVRTLVICGLNLDPCTS